MKATLVCKAALSLLFLSTTTALAAGDSTASQPAGSGPGIGDRPPLLQANVLLQAPAAAKLSAESLRGKVVVLEFWSTYCAPCVMALPHLNALADKFKDQPVQFVSITDEDEAKVKPFLARKPTSGWVALDTDRAMARAYGVEAIPLTVVLGKDGTIAAITYPTHLQEQHISDLLAGKKVSLPVQRPVSPTTERPDQESGTPPLLEITVRPSKATYSSSRTTPGSMTATGCSPKELVGTAFDYSSVRMSIQGQLPEGTFDIALVQPDQSPEARRALLQLALRSAFGITAKQESRELDVLLLRVSKAGAPGLQVAASSAQGSSSGQGKMKAVGQSAAALARFLEVQLGIPVIDETGLKERYDVTLEWSASSSKPDREEVIKAVREQWGLELLTAKRPVEVLVVDVPANAAAATAGRTVALRPAATPPQAAEKPTPVPQNSPIVGTWRVLEASHNGQKTPIPPGAGMTMTFTADGNMVCASSGGRGGEQSEKHTYSLKGTEMSLGDAHGSQKGTVSFEGKDRVILDIAGEVRFTLERLASEGKTSAPPPRVTPAAGPSSRPAFENEPGWVWHIKPAEGWQSIATQGIVVRVDDFKDEQRVVTLASATEATRDVVRFRPVAFDESGKRLELTALSGGGTDGVFLQGYRLDLTRHGNVPRLGIEKLSRNNLRDVVAPAAYKALKAASVDAVPFPELDRPYEFELKTIAGSRISSQDLRGKVVLLDFWATWCKPCMNKMPHLKETYSKLHERGFEIVGINHDWSVEDAQKTIAKQQLPWAHVMAPLDLEHRKLWQTAVGDGPLPLLLLIDRHGVLRGSVTPSQLDAAIEKLVATP